MATINSLQSRLGSANQVGEYLKRSLLRLRKPSSHYLTPKNAHGFNFVSA